MKVKEIQDWLIRQIAEILNMDPDEIDIREPFANYGLSSLDVITLSGDLETFLGRRLSPTLAYDYPNILSLSHYLAEENAAAQAGSAGPGQQGQWTKNEPIAIIGMSCRFPGAENPAAFWELLSHGVDAIREVPEDRWQKDRFFELPSGG